MNVGGYTLTRPLGRGASARVWQATDPAGEVCAIKLLSVPENLESVARRRLAREAALVHRLDSPGIAAVIDVETDGAEAFVVSEYIDGPTLAQDVEENGPLPLPAAARLARDLADALETAHDAGVVHRDLKPSNVMLAPRGAVLIDFGIAQSIDDERLTGTGLVAGTPGYLAPELIEGGEPSPATDWWAWAAVIAYALLGHSPFGNGAIGAVVARICSDRPDLSGISDARLERILRRSLGTDVAARPAPAALIDALENCQFPALEVAGSYPSTSVYPVADEFDQAVQDADRTAAYPVAGAELIDPETGQPLPPDESPEAEEGAPEEHPDPAPLPFFGMALAVSVGACAVGAWPWAAIIALIVLIISGLTGTISEGLDRNRGRVMGAIASLPWHLLRGLVWGLAGMAIIAGLIMAAQWIATDIDRYAGIPLGDLTINPNQPLRAVLSVPALALALGVSGVIGLCWAIPAAVPLRRGARLAARKVFPAWYWRFLIGLILLAVSLVFLFVPAAFG